MDAENAAVVERILKEDYEMINGKNPDHDHDDDSGWKTVSYAKRNRKVAKQPENLSPGFSSDGDVFRDVEKRSAEGMLRLAIKAAKKEEEFYGEDARRVSEEEEQNGDDEGDVREGGDVAEVKKGKKRKTKKVKGTVAEAAEKLDASDLCAFLLDVTGAYEKQHDIQLMRFVDYFGRAFASVSSSQFPWTKMLKESRVYQMEDIPLSYIPEAVYATAADWVNQQPIDALGSFVIWSTDTILADLENHQAITKGSKKVPQQARSTSQVAIFVVLAISLRQKPDTLFNLLPLMMDNQKYQGQDKLPFTVWMIIQASQGDLVIGLYLWVHFLFPMLNSKPSCNPQSRDLILQLAERIMSLPKARRILINSPIRKGKRLLPPTMLELLMRVTFPDIPYQVKAYCQEASREEHFSCDCRATGRLQTIYPSLKEIALAGSAGSKAMKQVTEEIFRFIVKAAGEDNCELSREASNVFIWCLTNNPDCFKEWDALYLDNIEASIAVLENLSNGWSDKLIKHLSSDLLTDILKNFRRKNKKALASGQDATHLPAFKVADKYCKLILGRQSRGHGCTKSIALLSVAIVFGAAIMSRNLKSWDLKSLM